MASRERRALTGYVTAYTVSILGDRFGELALPLVLLAATGDPLAAGAVGASMQVPYFVLSLWLGEQTDRRSRRVLMVGADVLRAACFGLFAWLAAAHVGSLVPYLVLGFVVGCGNVVFGLAGSALLPEIVRGDRLVRANALVEAGDAVSTVTGPALAGAVIARLGTTLALAADALSFLVSGILLIWLRLPAGRPARQRDPGASPSPTGRLRRMGRPLRELVRDPTQRAIQVALIVLSAHGAGVVLAIIVYARSELGLSTEGSAGV
ncbi:MFS transporter [Symbioplanes lichenis]|uniref:MFS transporter n=1 Tax=Symbioplanes lichenis TaxID=1629072 RepID=UPI0027398406|nr:MFS transporter [Actinoplanes lichenis]